MLKIVSKALLRKLHINVALVVGLFLILQGFSGAALLFRDAVEPVIHPTLQLVQTNRLSSHDENLALIGQRYPNHILKRVELPRRGNVAIIFKLEGKKDSEPFLVALDPYRNEIVRDGALSAWPFELLLHWHEHMNAGSLGEKAIGLLGISLLFMVVTGLVLWWPKGRFRNGFRLNGVTAKNKWTMRHRFVGATVAILLVLSGSTGSLMVFKDSFRDVLGYLGPVAAKPSLKVQSREGEHVISVSALRVKADRVAAGENLRQLRFSGDHGQGVSFYYDAPAGTFGGITNFVSFDRYSGKETGRYVSSELPRNNNLVDYLYTLHTGNIAGGLLKILLLFSGFALIFLPISGLITWIGKRRSPNRSRLPKLSENN